MEHNWEQLKDDPNGTEWEPQREAPFDPAKGDALQTLMEWLYGRMSAE